MVLSLMRRHAKSWLIKFLIAMIAIVFIFYFGYSFRSDRGIKIARVNGDVIGGLEYQKAYRDMIEGLQRQYGDRWNQDLVKALNLRQRALDSLIDAKLIEREARRLGLEVTEREIQDAVAAYPAFQIDGRFDLGRYRSLLGYNRMEPEDFEAEISQQLLQRKLRSFLTAFMMVTDNEIRDQFAYENEKVKIAYTALQPKSFEAKVEVDEAGIQGFYDENKERYRVPEKVKVTYLELDPADFQDLVTVTEREIGLYYEYNPERFQVPKEVSARHILFRLEESATSEEEEAAMIKAAGVLGKAKAGEDFATLAQTHSEGPTAANGGDLGYFTEGRMVETFEKAAFALGKGEISGLVRTPFGIHIIKVEDIREARTRSLEEAREEIRGILEKNARAELAHEKGLTLVDQMPYEVDLTQYGSENGLEAKETDYFTGAGPIPGIAADREFIQRLFELEEKEASGLREFNEKFYIFQVADRQASFIPELDAVREEVRQDVTRDLAAKKASAAGGELLAALKASRPWAEALAEQGLESKESDFFTRRESVPDMGYIPDLTDVVFRLDEESPYPEAPFTNDGGTFVVRWEGRQPIDEVQMEQDRGMYRFGGMQTKGDRAFRSWLSSLREQAEIEILTPIE